MSDTAHPLPAVNDAGAATPAQPRDKPPRLSRHIRQQLAAYEQARTRDEPPPNIDIFRYFLARRLNSLIAKHTQAWRQCPQRRCRRARRCDPSGVSCLALPPVEAASEEEAREAMAHLQRTLRDHTAALGIE